MKNNNQLFFIRRLAARVVMWIRSWIELIELLIHILTLTWYTPSMYIGFYKFNIIVDNQILSLYEKLLDKYQTPISDRHQTF